jgi:hypothetical protein
VAQFSDFDAYEDSLYDGTFLCIYSLLRQLLDFSLADCVAVLQRQVSSNWEVEQEVNAAGSRLRWSELVRLPEIREALNTLGSQAIGWERPECIGRTDPVMTFIVWSRAGGLSAHSNVSLVAFFHPRRIHRDPQTARDTPIVRRCHHLVTLWFALAGYRRVTRDGLWDVNHNSDHRLGMNSSIMPGRWPVSFREAVELIEDGLRERSRRNALLSKTLRRSARPD